MDFISFPPWVMVRWRRLWMRRWIRRWIQPRRMQFHLRHTVRFPCIFFEAVFITWFSARGRRIQRRRHRTITQGGKRLISLWDRCLERERERERETHLDDLRQINILLKCTFWLVLKVQKEKNYDVQRPPTAPTAQTAGAIALIFGQGVQMAGTIMAIMLETWNLSLSVNVNICSMQLNSLHIVVNFHRMKLKSCSCAQKQCLETRILRFHCK